MAVFLGCLLFISIVIGSGAACGLGSSCDNGGTCDGGKCQCVPGYTGELCEFAINLSQPADASYQESHGSVDVTVTRNPTGYPLTLTVSTSGTATSTSDFTLSANTLQFENADTSSTVTITIIDDDVSELDEEIILTMTANDGRSVTVTYTISASDPVTLSVQGDTTFAESDGTTTITIGCSLPSGTSRANFMIVSSDGTATSTDYSFSPEYSYSCTTSQTLTLTVNLLQDNIPETSETFSLDFSSGLPFTGLTGSSVEITITDDDPLQITLNIPDEVTEGSASINFAGTSFLFEKGQAVPVTLTLTVVGITAALNTDFTMSDDDGIVTFTYIESVQTSRQTLNNFQINFLEDSILEPDKTLTVTFTSDYVISGTTSKTITIKDDELETININGPSSVSENEGLVNYTLDRTSPFRAISVTYVVTAALIDTALYNTNVQEKTETVELSIGELSKQFGVTIVNDNLIQTVPKSFTLSASGVRINAVQAKTVTITEDDSYTVTFSAVTVTEGDTITVTFTRDITAGALTINVETTDASAVAGSDYTTQTTSLEFVDGADTVTLTIPTLEDQIYEESETLTVSITSASIPLAAASTASETMTINDDDVETLTITGGGNVDENGGSITLTITRTATFEQLIVTASTVIPATSGNVPATTDDIVMQTGVQLTFAIGAASVTFTVAITDDSTLEPNEDFIVSIDAPDPIVDVTAVVTIVNDDPDIVSLPSFLAVFENGGTKDITITRTVGGNEITVQVNTNDGTAKAGTDYTALTNYDVTFAAGSLTTTFTVTVQDDSDDEDDETFTLVVSGDKVITTDAYTFTIVDDEGSRPFDCRRNNQDCANSADVCSPETPLCECKGSPAREGDMCNIITDQKNGAACTTTCNNHGVCLDNSGSTSCACYPGYYGDDCEHYFLQAVCSSENMILIANPHGTFAGLIYVNGKAGTSACTATAVPDPPQQNDNIDDSLKGYSLTVRHDSTTCGVITPQENAQTSKTSYSREFRIQYDPLITTGLDQCVTVTCSFDKNNVLAGSGVVSIDSNGPFVEENAGNEFSPLTLTVDIDGTPVTEASTVVLAKKLCVTIHVPQDFGGLEIIDIEFNNTLQDDPSKWKVYESGCTASRAISVLVNEPFYPESGNKRTVKFCFFAFKFINSQQLTVQVKLKVCVNPDECRLGTCEPRRKRQVVSSRETTVKATFNIIDTGTQTSENRQNQTDGSSEAVCTLPFKFVPTVVCLGALNMILVLLCIYLTCRLSQTTTSTRRKEPTFYCIH